MEKHAIDLALTQEIAGYCRISVDEELDRDNTSIENQKKIIDEFVKAKFPKCKLSIYEVLYNKYTNIAIHQFLTKLLVAFTLLKGISGTVTVFIYRKLALGKFGFYKLVDNLLLILDGGIVSV